MHIHIHVCMMQDLMMHAPSQNICSNSLAKCILYLSSPFAASTYLIISPWLTSRPTNVWHFLSIYTLTYLQVYSNYFIRLNRFFSRHFHLNFTLFSFFATLSPFSSRSARLGCTLRRVSIYSFPWLVSVAKLSWLFPRLSRQGNLWVLE